MAILSVEKKVEVSLIEDVKVYGDWNRLEQVMTNFLTNAIRHVDEGGTLFVKMIDCDDNISIEVENTERGVKFYFKVPKL